jgi:hypothetical protein
MKKLSRSSFVVLSCALAAAACRGGESATTMEQPVLKFEQITPEQWNRLAGERIFFGHQSVGSNIMDGVRDIMASNKNVRLNIVDATNVTDMSAPGFYHAPVGKNGEPATKLADFRKRVPAMADSGIALMKYCYVDVGLTTDPKKLFEEYRQNVDAIRAENPNLTVVHMTLPLLTDAGTLRHVAALARRKPTGRQLNLIRHQFNEMLRTTYGGREPIFDLASLEATKSNGEMKLVNYKGARFPVLAQEWTYDGGHLNEAGRRRIAEAFLTMLVSVQQPALSMQQ